MNPLGEEPNPLLRVLLCETNSRSVATFIAACLGTARFKKIRVPFGNSSIKEARTTRRANVKNETYFIEEIKRVIHIDAPLCSKLEGSWNL
jgi:hypothetical protein